MKMALYLMTAQIRNNQVLPGLDKRESLKTTSYTARHTTKAQQTSPTNTKSAISRNQTGTFESVTGYYKPIQASVDGEDSFPGLLHGCGNGDDSGGGSYGLLCA